MTDGTIENIPRQNKKNELSSEMQKQVARVQEEFTKKMRDLN